MSVADELEKLANFRDNGVLTEGEFQVQKAKILGKKEPPIIDKVVAQKNETQEIIEKYGVNTKNIYETLSGRGDTTAKTASKKGEISSYITILFWHC